jgi:hypothetical protein
MFPGKPRTRTAQSKLFQPTPLRPSCQRPSDAFGSVRASGRASNQPASPSAEDVLELEHHVDLAAGGVGEVPRRLDGGAGRLGDDEQRLQAPCEHLAVQLLHELVQPRPVDEIRLSGAEAPTHTDCAVGQCGVLG